MSKSPRTPKPADEASWSAFESWDLPVLVLDLDGRRVVRANAVARDEFGLGQPGRVAGLEPVLGTDAATLEVLGQGLLRDDGRGVVECAAGLDGRRLRLWRDGDSPGLSRVWALGLPVLPTPEGIRQALHDLRVPLTSIRYSEELMRRQELPSTAVRYLGVIRDSSERLSNLLSELSRRIAGGH